MLINRLVTENFGQYAKMDYRFGPGVIGIVGPNAAGKSTLLEALCATLTGEYAGPKAERIRRGVDDDAPAYVEGHWTVGEQSFSVRRDLRSSAVVLKKGKAEISGTAAVKDKLQDILMLPTRVIQDYSFIKQGDLFAFLSRSGPKRAQGFAHLCGVAHAEKIRKAISDELSEHFSDLGEVDLDAVDSLHRRHRSLEKQLEETEAELKRLEATALSAEQLAVHKEALKRFNACETAKQRVTEATTAYQETRKALPKLQQSLAAMTAQEDLEKKRQRLLTLTEQVGVARKREKLETQLAELQDLREPPETDWPALIEDLHQQLYDNSAEVNRVSKRLALLEEGLSECNTCGQPIPAPEKHEAKDLKEAQRLSAERRKKLEKQLTSTEAKQAKAQEEKVAYLTAAKTKANVQQELAELPEAVDSLAELTKRRNRLKEAIEAADTQAEKRDELQKLYDAAVARQTVRKEALATAEAELAAAEKRLRIFKKKNKLKAVTATAIEQAERTATAMAECRGRATVLQSSLAETAAEVKRVTTRLAAEKPRRVYKNRLLGIRDACRYNQLPQKVILATLRRLEGKTNGFLRKIGADFTIEVDDDLVFTAVVGDDREKAEYFSFGQKVMTALSFLLACNRVFAGVCDFLALDEPSEYLDRQHVEDFAELLGVLDKRFRRHGRQLLVVTHNRALLDSLVQTVDLSRSL
jgi:exonuclease SbcC